MNDKTSPNIIERPELRDRTRVFRNRHHAGEVLAEMLSSYSKTDAIVLAIPAGGVPVAAAIVERLHIPLDVAVVSKITLPWNTEVGYGAVAFDKTMRLNEDLVAHAGLTRELIQQGIDQATQKVLRRVKKFRGDWPFPDLTKRQAILVDDGLASGFTLLVAVEALRKAGARHICVAVPTAHESSPQRVAPAVEAVYCANIRGGFSFAVADAYAHWADVAEEVAIELYRRLSPHD
jgi:putative phosphoribosyl transferase